MDERAIGVFDSGLGGLTAVKKLMDVLPHESIIYFGDTGRVPYGGRSRETILKYARQDIAFLRSFNIKAVVAACGTVSTNGLEEISGEYDIPVRGVARAAAGAAVKATRNGKIGVIGTNASIRSGAYERIIKGMAPESCVIMKACPLFVPVIEDGRTGRDDPLLGLLADEYLLPLLESGIDTLIMGCTHYPIISEVISDRLGDGVRLVDPGAETAEELASFLKENDLLSSGSAGVYKYFVSDSTDDFAAKAGIFLGRNVDGDVKQVAVDELQSRAF